MEHNRHRESPLYGYTVHRAYSATNRSGKLYAAPDERRFVTLLDRCGGVCDCRIAARPASSPSPWIRHVEFARTYSKGGSLRLPSRDETVADIRIRGRKIPRRSGGLAIRNTGWNVRSCSYVGLPSCGTPASESLSPAMASHSLRSRNAAEHQRALIQMTGPECQYMFVNGPECRRKSP
jgi:hypothetical protein